MKKIFIICVFIICNSVLYSNNINGLTYDIFYKINGVWGASSKSSEENTGLYSWGTDQNYGYGIIIDFGYKKLLLKV